jgi:hypothetical protein
MPYAVPEFGPTLSAELQAVEQGEYRARYGSIDLKSAKSLVNRYVQNIPVESTARATKESLHTSHAEVWRKSTRAPCPFTSRG